MDWKETVTSVTDKVFPGINYKIDSNLVDCEVVTNLPLQVTLYFNVIFLPFWIVLLSIFLYENFTCYDELYKILTLAVVITVISMEILFRLYLGYEGNLSDKIPELAGFWMLSLLIQFPLQGFLLFNPYFEFSPLEVVPQSIMFIFVVTQLILGYVTLKNTARQQTLYFKVMKLGKKS